MVGKVPVGQTVQEVLKDSGKMVTSGNSCNRENNESESCPDDSRSLQSPATEVLHAETTRVQVGDCDSNRGKDEDELDKLAESVDGRVVADESLVHKSTCAGGVEGFRETLVGGDSSSECCTEPHDEDLARDERDVSPGEEAAGSHIFFHVDRVISGEGTPSDGVSKTCRKERHEVGHFSLS